MSGVGVASAAGESETPSVGGESARNVSVTGAVQAGSSRSAARTVSGAGLVQRIST